MHYSLCLEIGGDGWCTAWVAQLPGAHISRPSEREALAVMPQEITAYLRWLRHFGEGIAYPRSVDVEVSERRVFRAGLRHGGTQAFFEIDRPSMTLREVRQQLRWLQHSRRMLHMLVDGLAPAQLAWGTPGRKGRPPGKGGGGWTIGLYLRHIGGVEKWYLRQFWRGLPRLTRSSTPFDRLANARTQVLQVIGHPRRTDLSRTYRPYGESWTLRKVLRRLLYHERYHMRTIAQILLRHNWPTPPWLRSALGIPTLLGE